MKLINYKSKKGIVNLFSDFILNRIDKNFKSIIQVSDFGHFFVINGLTESTQVLDCSKIRDEFISDNQELLKSLEIKQINIMDLIKYDVKDWTKKETFFWTYHNSDSPIFKEEVINYKFESNELLSVIHDNDFIFEIAPTLKNYPSKFNFSSLNVTSEFPYGYSIKTMRNLFYYFENVFFNVKNSLLEKTFTVEFTNEKNEENDLNLKIYTDGKINQRLTSIVLDCFDFDFEKFNQKLFDYNFCFDLINPFGEKKWIEKNVDAKDLHFI